MSQQMTRSDTLQLVLIIAGAGAASLLVVRITDVVSARMREPVVLALMLIGVGLLSLRYSRTLPTPSWFHPLALPALYLSIVMTIPAIWSMLSGQRLGLLDPSDVDRGLVGISVLTLLGFISAAVLLARFQKQRPRGAKRPSRGIDYRTVSYAVRGLMILLITVSLVGFVQVSGSPYGANQIGYSVHQAAFSAVTIGFVPTLLLHLNAEQKLHGRVRFLSLMMPLFLVATRLAAGDRIILLALSIVLLWYRDVFVRRWQGVSLAIIGAIMLTILGAIAPIRSLTFKAADANEAISTGIHSISSPLGITATLDDLIPSTAEYQDGRTYLEATKYLLPGPFARTLFGEPEETGTFLFRRLMGFSNESVGFSFSMTSEAFLNFGLLGVAGVAFLSGAGLTLTWTWFDERMDRTRHYLYPLLVAYFPLLLRSDFLTQAKLILYGLGLVTFVLRLAAYIAQLRTKMDSNPVRQKRKHERATKSLSSAN